MREPIELSAERRVLWIGRLALVWALLIAGQLVRLQVVKHGDYEAAARSQHHRAYLTIPDRGEILDRTGHPLAVSVRTNSAVINPQLVKSPVFFAGIVAPILGLDPGEVAARIEEMQRRPDVHNSGRNYYELKRHLTAAEVNSLRKLPFPFIEIHRDARREYPNGPTGAHVIGSVDRFSTGNYGVELKLDKELRGAKGRMRALTDSLSGKYFSWFERPTTQGADIVLTLDSVIQHEAEKWLAEGVRDSGAEYGSVVVMDPENGEILALANYPAFDPGEEIPAQGAAKDAALARRRNYAIWAPFEPGSVMKMITVTMGIDTGRFTPDSVIFCENGAFPRPGRRPIRDLGRYGALPLSMVLVKSSNIGVTKVSLAVGPDTMWNYLGKFGLGQRTGLELPGESRGLFKPRYCLDKDGKPQKQIDETRCWGPNTHEYVSFGHEIGATAVQLARATAVIANGGKLVFPRLVLSKERPLGNGRTEPVPVLVREPERVIKAESAFTVRKIMQQVVEEGTGRRARLDGYSSGGKTGSAEVWDGRVKRRDLNNASFIGFAPVANPRVAVVVTLGRTPRQGGAAAAPIFKKVTEAALRVLQVPKDEPESVSLPVELAEAAAPPPPEPVEPEPEEEPAAEESLLLAGGLIEGPRVPDFRGKPVVAVMKESTRAGLPVRIVGRGLARTQSPPPGAILPAGQEIHVEFRP
jgi:cell division protein FtsI (penicillin-binding protein 3)